MTDYIKFVPQVACYFNVSQDYVLQVYQHVQVTSENSYRGARGLCGLLTRMPSTN